jgi:hypothetical protein
MQCGTSPKMVGIRWKHRLSKAKAHACLSVILSVLKLVLKIVSVRVNACVKTISIAPSKTRLSCT